MTRGYRFALVFWDREHEGGAPTQETLVDYFCAELLELRGSINYIADRLEDALALPELISQIDSCEYHFQNYILRTYLISERVQRILSTRAGVNLDAWRDNARDYLDALEGERPQIARSYRDMRSIWARHKETRKLITHERIPSFALYSENDVFDPDDVITEIKSRCGPEEGRQALDNIHKMLREFVSGQVAEIRALSGPLLQFVESVNLHN